MGRKLASIQTIDKLEPIANADAIEKATILGWQCVVKKGEFKEGDRCVYLEIDSVLPDKPEFEFMRPRKFRVRTIRLRGQISQGLVFPLSFVPEAERKLIEEGDWKLGTDVSELLEISLYCPPIPTCLTGEIKGKFPDFIPKTDETRVQVLGNVLKRHAGTMCYLTEKIDGSSVTYYLKDGEFGVCSRNLELKETEANAYWQAAREMKIEEILRTYGKNLAIQGELFGAGIQENSLKMRERTVRFFNAFDIDRYCYLDCEDFKTTMEALKLPTVPILSENFILHDNIEELVKLSTDKSSINPKVWREGIVIRPLTEKMDLEMASGFGNGRVSFKVVNPEYLIDNES